MTNLLGLAGLGSHEIDGLIIDAARCLSTTDKRATFANVATSQVAILCWPSRSEEGTGSMSTARDCEIVDLFKEAADRVGISSAIAYPDPIEPFRDVIRFAGLTANAADFSLSAVVVRHRHAGVPEQIAQLDILTEAGTDVINGGDGAHEDPTEALAYLAFLSNRGLRIEGANCLIVGDLLFNPIGRSLTYGLAYLGAEVHLLGPPSFVPPVWHPAENVIVHNTLSSLRSPPDVVFSFPIVKTACERALYASTTQYVEMFELKRYISKGNTFIIPCACDPDEIVADPLTQLGSEFDGDFQIIPRVIRVAARMAAYRFVGDSSIET